MFEMKRYLLPLALLTLISVVFLPCVISFENQELNDETRQRATGSFVSTPMGTTHYEVSGPDNGQPVVLVHGFSSPMYVWDNTAPALAAAGYKVIRFDSMGRGYSDRPKAVYDAEFLAEQIRQLLDALKITQPVDIVGYSMGGPVSAQFAIKNPDRVARIALLAPYNTAGNFGPVTWPLIGDWLAQAVLPSRMPSRQSGSFYEPERFPTAEEQFREQMVYKGFIRAIHSSLKTILAHDQHDRFAELAKLNKSTLLMWGQHDAVVPHSQSEAIRRVLNNPAFITLENSGHAPALEEPEIVNSALIDWFTR